MKSPRMGMENGRIATEGSFTCNAANPVTLPIGDGVPLRTGVGTFTITYPRVMGTLVSGGATIDQGTGDQIVKGPTHATTTGVSVLTFSCVDISGAAAADINAQRINWWATFTEKYQG